MISVSARLALLALLAGLAGPAAPQPSREPLVQGARVEPNVVYGMYSGLALVLDVHRPATPNGYGVIFISGSGWQAPTTYDATPAQAEPDPDLGPGAAEGRLHGLRPEPPRGAALPLPGRGRRRAARHPLRPAPRQGLRRSIRRASAAWAARRAGT